MHGPMLNRALDDPKGEHGKFAFVRGFSRNRGPDRGGLLQFFSPDHRPGDALSPGFNKLDLFDVRHLRSATCMAPFAQAPRLAVSGWHVKGDPLRSH